MDDNEVADILGISAIIINDLKQKRKKDYNFSWESALQVQVPCLICLCSTNQVWFKILIVFLIFE